MGNNTSRPGGYPGDSIYPHPNAFQPPTKSRRQRPWYKSKRDDDVYDYDYNQNIQPQMQQFPQSLSFRPEQYRLAQTPPPLMHFPRPPHNTSRPVIPTIPNVNATNVVPNIVPNSGRMRVRTRTQTPAIYAQDDPAMTMPQPVIPNIAGQQTNNAPVIPQMPQQSAMPEPVQFPEPQVPDSAFPPPQNSRLAPGQYGPYSVPETPLNNPLPEPPKDIFEMSPYVSLLAELRKPVDESTIKRNIIIPGSQPMHINVGADYRTAPRTGTRRHRRKGSLLNVFGSRRRRDEIDDDDDVGAPPILAQPAMYAVPTMQQMSDGNPAFMYNIPSQMMQVAADGGAVPIPVQGATPMPAGMPGPDTWRGPSPARIHTPTPGRMATPAPARPVMKVDPGNELAGLIHWSPHRVHYNSKSYPTAFHLLEAMKFIDHRPDIAERIRTSGSVEEARAVSVASHHDMRPDWENVLLDKMDEILYQKMIQYPTLRAVLLSTDIADLVFNDRNDNFWGDGPLGQGANQLGKALVRLRERLKAEGFGT
ncbi:uncharacterized protein FIBRA_05469 [Fibroporia radiculosa]|uniref:NADAR domain-containing protein n=1 Tax=Fibroporia radiculosa TaxID=599839 RepID=J4GR26_9APHY|nr:uncharacterized protein FIBRA_05469 [Fibroporia radiculosa]CCM03340.1 predicted protein [Fibroporia radiculosa]